MVIANVYCTYCQDHKLSSLRNMFEPKLKWLEYSLGPTILEMVKVGPCQDKSSLQ